MPLFTLLSTTASALPSRHSARDFTYTTLGCFTDLTDGKRALNDMHYATDDMTIEKCASFCSSFALFGVEYGRECYCGNSRNPTSTLADSKDCSFSCSGDSNSKCGAGNRINIYNNAKPKVQAPATLSGASSLGCFVEAAHRVLPSKAISGSDMTAAKCATNCAGFDYFGTQWSSECYCGNTLPTVSAPASECNMACSGKGDEVCGGNLRLNVYKFDQASVTAPAPAAVSGFEYKGCYADNIPQRVLSGKVTKSAAMTLEMCAAACGGSGYTWFGVEFGSECYCGTQLDAASSLASERECSMKCSGSGSQNCGGSNRLNVYRTDISGTASSKESIGGFHYQSCWTDKVDDRSLKAVDYRTDDMTVEKCAKRCEAYAYFGLEYSRECFCGNDLIGQAAPEKDCDDIVDSSTFPILDFSIFFIVSFSILFIVSFSILFIVDFSALLIVDFTTLILDF
ncbi:uncharacterized protein CTRU02_201299 [Colletotrichum truncatum]|uniref:Uncharacterized protein n=1 Tax=Colletotrichum truncatum TaxID=5467 RepID=A0ACC3ZHK1_COLTU